MKLLLGSVLSGLALFLCGMISFGFLRWHDPKELKDDSALAAAIKASVTEPGAYGVPSKLKPDGSHLTDDEWMTRWQSGPYLLGVIRPGASQRPMLSYLAASLVYNILVSLVLAIILSRFTLSYVCTIRISAMIGLFAGLSNWLQAANWYEYPASYWVPFVIDAVIQGAVAGAILGKFVRKGGAGEPAA